MARTLRAARGRTARAASGVRTQP